MKARARLLSQKDQWVVQRQLWSQQKYLLCQEALMPAFVFAEAGMKKKALFKLTLNFSRFNIRFGDWNKLDQVADALFLRTIPSFTTSAAENCEELKREILSICGRPLGLMVGALQHFELFADSSIKPQDWLNAGVAQYHVPMEDFTAEIHTDAMLSIVDVIHQYRQRGYAVVAHCKAGRSRSSCILLAYLMVYGDGDKLPPGSDLATVLAYVVSNRKQVDLSGEKKQKSIDTVERMNLGDLPPTMRSFVIDEKNPVPVFKEFLSSLELKNYLAQSLVLKMMGGYFSKNAGSDRAKFLSQFTKSVLLAKGDTWYANLLMKRHEAVHKFINADKFAALDDWKKRKELMDGFEKTLDQVMMMMFKCNEKELACYKKAYITCYKENMFSYVTTVCDKERGYILKDTNSPQKCGLFGAREVTTACDKEVGVILAGKGIKKR